MSLDVVVLALYGLGMLLLGWFGLRRSRNHEDFLVAGRQLGPARYMSTRKIRRREKYGDKNTAT
jgi:solute:Na+ symporter, SSS family